MGFSQMDRIVLSVIKCFIKIKLDNLYAIQRRKDMQREVLDSIRLAGTICNQRDKIALIKEMKD